MNLDELHIHCLRNISSARVSLNSRINFIVGDNGSGKTSFLEAIYLLGTGHSFRCREIASLITHQHDQLTVFGRTSDLQNISLQKSLKLPTVAKINQHTCVSNSELALFLPCQVFYQDIFQIIDSGPGFRRSLLDWGLFHVEHSYHTLWKQYRRALKQRNALLRSQSNYQQIKPWDKIISDTAEQLHVLRQEYFSRLIVEFDSILAQLTSFKCSLSYYKGWDRKNEKVSLEDVLAKTFASDSQRQFTHYGVHHADIVIENIAGKAKNVLSRGQQKIVLFALKMTQSRLLNTPCIFLIDDLTAELDQQHIKNIMNLINQIPGQFFISVRSGDNLLDRGLYSDSKSIEIKQGAIQS